MFIFFSIMILLKFIFLRTVLFGSPLPIWALLVEISAVLAIFALFEFIRNSKVKLFSYLFINLLLSILAFSSIVYFQYFQTLPTIYSFSAVGQVGTLSDSIFHIIKPSYFLLFTDFLIIATFPFWKKSLPFQDKKWNAIPIIITFFLCISLTVSQFAITKNKPIADTVYFAQQYGIMNYEYLMIKQFIEDNTTGTNGASAEETKALIEQIRDLKGLEIKPTNELLYHGVAEEKNLIIVQLESFQTLFIDLEVNGQEITPFINQLKDEMLYFTKMYQQVGPGNTSDAEFMVNTSILANNYEATAMKFGDRIFANSLPNLLNEKGYETMTAHSNTVDFWNRRPLYKGLGFSKYYDREFYQDEDFVLFGASDKVLYEKTLPEIEEIKNTGNPFYIQFIAVTSHYPYTIPAEKQYLDLPADLNGTFLGDLMQSMRYVDSTVEYLVTQLKEDGLWEDSLFVMYGDHSAMQSAETFQENIDQLSELTGQKLDTTKRFNIPLFIHDTNLEPQVINTLVGQVDVMPTIANLLGLDLSDKVIFGQDVLNYPNNTIGYRYYVPTGSFITEDFFFQPKSGFADGFAVNIEDGSQLVDFSAYEDQYNRMLKLYDLSDHYLKILPLQEGATTEAELVEE